MAVYKIEKNVNLDEMLRKNGRKSVYPYKEMELGDVFFVTDKQFPAVYQSAYSTGKALGMKFRVEKIIKDGKEMVAVERVALDWKKPTKAELEAKPDTKDNEQKSDEKPDNVVAIGAKKATRTRKAATKKAE